MFVKFQLRQRNSALMHVVQKNPQQLITVRKVSYINERGGFHVVCATEARRLSRSD